MDRPAQSLELLPLLVLERICFYIDDEGGSDILRRNLWAFSLASRRCCEAAAVQRFCQIHLRLRSADEIGDRVQQLIDKGLDNGRRFRHVRRLRVSGGMSRTEMAQAHGAVHDDRDIGEVDRDMHKKEGSSIRDVFGDDVHPFCRLRVDRHNRFVHGAYAATDAVKVTHGTNKAWLPLADLIRQLAGLRDLVWDATGFFPRHVLAAIHETPSFHPDQRSGGCRIHLHQFALYSLSQYREHPMQSPIDPDEYALATSHNLHCIAATVQGRMVLNRISYTGDAIVREMLGRGLAPNLRHVWFDRIRDNPFLGAHQDNNQVEDDEADAPWQGFFPRQNGLNSGSNNNNDDDAETESAEPRKRTTLKSLAFWKGVPKDTITYWLVGGRFAHLRNLSLFWGLDVIKHLADLAADGCFSALDGFTLLGAIEGHYLLRDQATCRTHHGNYPDGTSYEDEFALVNKRLAMQNLIMYLFHHLPPLRRLQYEGSLGIITARQIYKHHGSTLRQLGFTLEESVMHTYPGMCLLTFDEENAHQLAANCPNLEELSLDMQRTASDREEVNVYRALSNENFPFLERLELRLWYHIGLKDSDHIDVSQEPQYGSAEDQHQWEKARLSELEQLFVNCAVDAKLAHSIFDVLSCTQKGTGRLRHLRIDISRDRRSQAGMINPTFISALRWLARPHVCERRADGQVVVKETDPEKTKKGGDAWRILNLDAEGEVLVKSCKTAFLSLWPNTTKPWWEGWSSFPLKSIDKEEGCAD